MTHYAGTYHVNSSDYRAPDFKLSELTVTPFVDPERARGFVDAWKTRATESHHESYGGFVAAVPGDLDFGGPFMVRLYNTLAGETGPQVSRFSSKADAQRRIFALVVKVAGGGGEKDDGEAFAGPPESSEEQGPAINQEGEDDVAKAKTKKPTKPAAERKPRGAGKAAGKVADFRPVRDGTDRAKVLRLMNGKNTATQIAHESGIDEKKISTIVFCMSRDNGVGYEFGPKGELKALFPGQNTIKDAIKAKAD